MDTQDTPTQEYGIKETGNGDYNRISDNQVPKNATGGVDSVGANTTTGGNTDTTSL